MKEEEHRERRERAFQSNLEFWRTTYDVFKHSATVSLASIAAFAALLGGAFQKPPPVAGSMLSSITKHIPSFITPFGPEWFCEKRPAFVFAAF